jgi:hypothetical protein
VLIVHYHFLPVCNVAVKRLTNYARRLPELGWHPVVLTRDWRGIDGENPSWGLSWEPEVEQTVTFPIHHVEVPPAPRGARSAGLPWPLRKATSLATLMFGAYPDEFVRWTRPAVAAARRLAERAPIDAVVSYCPPESNHVVGGRIARALDVPWVPIFGDLWGFFLAPLPARSSGALIRKLYHHRWLAPAAACVAVSPYMAEYLSRTYRKHVELVLTGYDPGEFAHRSATAPGPRERLVISHVGSLYPGDQKPEIFFDGLDRLLGRHPELESQLEVQFVGSKCDEFLRALVQGRPCERVCVIRGKVSSTAAVELVRDSDVLLAFNCSAHRRRHGTMSHPTKIFESFGARRPVLAMPPDGDWVDELLARTGAGTSARDADAVASVLYEWFLAWRRDGAVPYDGRPAELETFTVERQVARLAALLDRVVDGRPQRRRGTR